jgi:hypothetical protein
VKKLLKRYAIVLSPLAFSQSWLPCQKVSVFIMLYLIIINSHFILTPNVSVIFPLYDIIHELPSLRHVRGCRTILLSVSKTLAANCLSKAKVWKQLHTDEKGRRQTQLVTAAINIIDENDGVFKSICLLSSIIAEDGTGDEQICAIIASFRESG